MESKEINIPAGLNVTLQGNLTVPENVKSLVIFSHGSGSSRFSTRNNYVARLLNKEKIAALLTDLLTLEEDKIYANRFNIDLLTMRLIAVTNHMRGLTQFKDLKVGFFGASTGAASALKAAAHLKDIDAVVSRGGRPDLAGDDLMNVTSPTLLIVGSLDAGVIELNERAYALLNCEKKIEIVSGATHLFEEPGKLDDVAELAADWFKKYLMKEEEVDVL